ncbi:endoplasmic reticulum membrane-associated RNA degradation protein-like [Culicoides brevitarsis]|uniref:endoplasmic reticulum membrane-associated RNA degradation protein-like n=1 Tax=Culicoides brevitarsis TaxID=469753 RepID=UPI00307B9F82
MKNNNAIETLSDEVKAFYSFKCCKKVSDGSKSCLEKENGLLDWSVINAWMRFDGLNEQEIDEILNNYEKCRERLPGFYEILNEIHQLERINEDFILKYGSWTFRIDDISALLKEKSNNFVILEQILTLTSILEFSLGNIFYTKNHANPPHLFKDLLKSDTIRDIFKEAIPFVRYVLGTPRSLNLRNIAWHGFLTVDYCSDVFSKLLLLIILSLGRDLGDFQILKRTFSVSSIEKFSLLKQNFDFRSSFEAENDEFNKNIQQLMTKNCHGRALQLLLIQIEAHVRQLFAKTNPNFNPRAKIDGYYFTLDMILDQNVCVGNEFFDETHKKCVTELLTDQNLSLFYDCFVSLKGPRIRDRMSHGELRFSDVTKDVVDVIYHLYHELTSKSAIKSVYNSFFHPISELKRKIKELETQLKAVNDLNIPEELPKSHFEQEINFFETKINPCDALRDPEFTKISKFVRILVQIIENCIESVKNYHEAIKIRTEEYKNRSLSQPRRKNLTKMVEIRAQIVQGIIFTEEIVYNFSENVEKIKFLSKNNPKEIKILLKIVENLKVQLSIERNDWKKALEGLEKLNFLAEKCKK